MQGFILSGQKNVFCNISERNFIQVSKVYLFTQVMIQSFLCDKRFMVLSALESN